MTPAALAFAEGYSAGRRGATGDARRRWPARLLLLWRLGWLAGRRDRAGR